MTQYKEAPTADDCGGRNEVETDQRTPIVADVEPSSDEEETEDGLIDKCGSLATTKDILSAFVSSLSQSGIAGEERTAMLIFLCMVSRLLPKPVSAAVKGVSAGGKSFIIDSTLKYFPLEAYFFVTSMSDKALAYLDEDLRHRILVIAEVTGQQSETFDYMLRSLLSEGRLRHITVGSNPETGELESREMIIEGPTGLLVTTTRVQLHKENETRMLSIPIDDSKDQTERILESIAEQAAHGPPSLVYSDDLDEWHALQAWLASCPNQVVIPFAPQIVLLVPSNRVRLRRDMNLVISLIQAHALLHRATRETDAGGAVIATIEDYAVVRSLVEPLLSGSRQVDVPESVWGVVDAVKHISSGSGRTVSNQEVAEHLGVDPATSSRHVKVALDQGLLANDEPRPSQPLRLRLGDPFPKDCSVLPTVEDLQLAIARLQAF